MFTVIKSILILAGTLLLGGCAVYYDEYAPRDTGYGYYYYPKYHYFIPAQSVHSFSYSRGCHPSHWGHRHRH